MLVTLLIQLFELVKPIIYSSSYYLFTLFDLNYLNDAILLK